MSEFPRNSEFAREAISPDHPEIASTSEDNLLSPKKYTLGRLTRDYVSALGLSLASAGKLEAFCISVGVAAATANPLVDHDVKVALAVLAVSYGTWFSGLWVNGKQVWRLLEEGRIPYSVMAKVGYDLSSASDQKIKGWAENRKGPIASVANWFADRRLFQKTAMGAGFVALEAGKEIPYYIAAFGGEAGVDFITQNLPEGVDINLNTHNAPLVFLAGANFAASAWNLGQGGLAKATRMGLDRKSAITKFIGKRFGVSREEVRPTSLPIGKYLTYLGVAAAIVVADHLTGKNRKDSDAENSSLL